MKRFEERKMNLYKAIKSLESGLAQEPDDLRIDGVLQRFEFTFELAWKCMKDYLELEGIVSSIGTPREIIQLAYKHNIIDNGDVWIDMMLSRNSLSHMYDENISRDIYDKIKDEYIVLLKKLIETI